MENEREPSPTEAVKGAVVSVAVGDDALLELRPMSVRYTNAQGVEDSFALGSRSRTTFGRDLDCDVVLGNKQARASRRARRSRVPVCATNPTETESKPLPETA